MPAARLEDLLAPVQAKYAAPHLREYQGRYWVTEFKRWTDHWREQEAHEEGSRLPALRDEQGLSWTPTLLGLLEATPAQELDGREPAEPRELGQALHLLLEKLDLATPAGKVTRGEPVTADDLRDQAETILHCYGFRPDLVAQEGLQWVCDFFNSESGRALLESWQEHPHDVQREVSFTLKLPLDDLQKMLAPLGQDEALIQGPKGVTGNLSGEWTLLQGQMDLLWRDADGTWCLLDYKSDHVPNAEELQRRVQVYTPQMRLYETAARKLWGADSLRSYLFFLRLGRAVEIPK
jgi:ATP-dependent exoDNAse (exonuclease V) beta subunit